MRYGTQGVGCLFQAKSALCHFTPRPIKMMLCHDFERPIEMRKITSPRTAHFNVLSVKLNMRIDINRTIVSILANHHNPAIITHHIQCLGNSARITGRFNNDISAAAFCVIAHPSGTIFRARGSRKIKKAILERKTRASTAIPLR